MKNKLDIKKAVLFNLPVTEKLLEGKVIDLSILRKIVNDYNAKHPENENTLDEIIKEAYYETNSARSYFGKST